VVEDGRDAVSAKMKNWSEANFLERLMSPRSQENTAKKSSCPDANSLAAFSENQADGFVSDAIAAHLKQCPECAEIHRRLVNFGMSGAAVQEAEWSSAEKRLRNWMDGFLRAETRSLHETSPQDTAHSVTGRSWLSSWKTLSALGAFAVFAIAATTILYFRTGLWRSSTGMTAVSTPETTLTAQDQQKPLPQSPTFPTPTDSAPKAARQSSPNPGSSTEPASRALLVPPQASRAVPGAQNPNRPVAPSPTPATAGPNINEAVLGPEVKQILADEVQMELAAEKDAATNPQLASVPSNVPGALQPRYSAFIVSHVVSLQTDDGQTCSLTGGDILTRITNTPNANQNVKVLVTSAKSNDCATGTQLAMSAEELQDIYNDFRENLDAGLQKLADNQGKDGMPSGPLAGGRPNPDGTAAPSQSAQSELQQQQTEANNTEDDVERATEGVVPSAFRRSGSPPVGSSPYLRAIRPYANEFTDQRVAVSGEFSLVAWTPGPQESNSHPQQGSPPKTPAPNKPPAAPPQKPASQPHPASPQPRAPKSNQPTQPHSSPPRKSTTMSVGRFTPPRGASARPDGKGGTAYKAPNGTEYHAGSNGRLTSLRRPNGLEAKFNTNGKIASIHTTSGMTIYRTPNGARRVETVRTDGTRLVSTGRNRGFVEHTFTHGGRDYVSRTYVVNGRAYARVYDRYFYHGAYFYHYVPAYFYAPAFYGWAYNPWAAPVYWNWGWGPAQWYGFYGYYFVPAQYYPSPALWLTDYLLATNLQAAYDAQSEASSSINPGQSVPGSSIHAIVLPFDSSQPLVDEMKVQSAGISGLSSKLSFDAVPLLRRSLG
jgi:hypothetical protein